MPVFVCVLLARTIVGYFVGTLERIAVADNFAEVVVAGTDARKAWLVHGRLRDVGEGRNGSLCLDGQA